MLCVKERKKRKLKEMDITYDVAQANVNAK